MFRESFFNLSFVHWAWPVQVMVGLYLLSYRIVFCLLFHFIFEKFHPPHASPIHYKGVPFTHISRHRFHYKSQERTLAPFFSVFQVGYKDYIFSVFLAGEGRVFPCFNTSWYFQLFNPQYQTINCIITVDYKKGKPGEILGRKAMGPPSGCQAAEEIISMYRNIKPASLFEGQAFF